jgi:hypothetical protein
LYPEKATATSLVSGQTIREKEFQHLQEDTRNDELALAGKVEMKKTAMNTLSFIVEAAAGSGKQVTL